MLLALIEYQRKQLIINSIEQDEGEFGAQLDIEMETKLNEAFSQASVNVKLKPARSETADNLRQKSDNCINPYVTFDIKANKKITSIIDHVATKLFKEEPKKVVIKLDGTEYSYMRCEDHDIRLQDLILVQDTDVLEQILNEESPKQQYALTLKYEIYEKIPEYVPNYEAGEQISFPEDLSESELLEMLTEVMSIMLFNKDEKVRKF